MLFNHLRGHWHWRRFGGELPGLVDEVQVAVHPSHLVQSEGVCTGIICRKSRSMLGMQMEFWIDMQQRVVVEGPDHMNKKKPPALV